MTCNRSKCQAGRQFVQWMLAASLFTFFEGLSGIAILPQLVISMVCSHSGSNYVINKTTVLNHSPSRCNETSDEMVITATDWYKEIVRDNNLVSLLVITLMGVASDSIGRKPIVLLIAIGTTLDRLATALSPTLTIVHYVHTAAGLVSSRYVFFAVSFAAMADFSSDRTRSKDYSWLEAAMYTGMVLGPYTGGLLAQKFGLETPFYATAAGCLFTCFYILLFVQESKSFNQSKCGFTVGDVTCSDDAETELMSPRLAVTSSLPFKHKKCLALTPFGSICILFRSRLWLTLTVMLFFNFLAWFTFLFVLPLYTKYEFNWGPYETGLYFSLHNFVRTIGNGPISRLLPLDDQARVVLAGTCGILFFASISYYTQGWMLYAFAWCAVVSAFSTPTLRGTASKISALDEQGAVLGAVAMTEAFMATVTPLLCAPLFDWLVNVRLSSYIFSLAACGLAALSLVAACAYPTKAVSIETINIQ